MYKILSKRPETSESYMRAWWVHRDASKGIAYVTIPRKVPMHVHLDADHVVTVIEGFAVVSLGGAKAWLSPGDTLAIPRGMAHEIQRVGAKRLLMLDVSTPCGDMDKTFWIEEPTLGAPGAVANARPRPAAPKLPPPVKDRAAAPAKKPGAR
jgi:mannose-6-phosphate isomerase-like protein (cupin superfamily)